THRREAQGTMANFVITGKADQVDESSYTVQSTGEVVTKMQLTLNVPGMTDHVLCEMPLDVAPKSDTLSNGRWTRHGSSSPLTPCARWASRGAMPVQARRRSARW